ncbi:MAG: EAL domain-containing protein [Burkholderiaceae bacterium]
MSPHPEEPLGSLPSEPKAPIKVLMVEDEADEAALLVREIRKGGLDIDPIRVDNRAALVKALAEFNPDVVLSDYSLPGFGGMEALEIVRSTVPETPLVFVSGTIGEERAIQALTCGAADYVLKDNRARLVPALRRALQEAAERKARRIATLRLQESERRFQLFMHHLPSAVTMVDEVGRIAYANSSAESIFGTPGHSIVGSSVHEIYSDDHAKVSLARGKQAISSQAVVSDLEAVRTSRGVRQFHTHRFPLLDHEGNVVLVGTIATDLTENVQQQQDIRRLSQFHALRSAINVAIVRATHERELFGEVALAAVSVGGFRAAAVAVLGRRRERLVLVARHGLDQHQLSEILSDPSVAGPRGAIGRAIRTKHTEIVDNAEAFWSDNSENLPTSGGQAGLAVVPLISENRVVGLLGLATDDIASLDTAQRNRLDDLGADLSFALNHLATEQRLHYVVEFDSLTGVYNRQHFFERLAEAMRPKDGRHEQIAVIAIDLQLFRHINQAFGRGVGDQVLQEFAARLRSHFGGPSAMVARLGGDRFVVAVLREQASHLGRFLEATVLPSISEPIVVGTRSIHVSVKFGIAFCPGDGTEADTVLRNAETALQRAKDTVESYMFYSPEMSTRVAARLLLESQLKTALSTGQFVLHYQPKVHLVTRKLLGLEALIRWNDPKRGLISPVEFVPLLEETGMIVSVGEWVIKRVIRDVRQWRARGFSVPRIAVNVSQRQVHEKDFVQSTLRALDGIKGIDLEVTESIIMEDSDSSVEKLRELRRSGIRIVMDDFGTGYSSLSQLVRLPLDALKIDRAFISDMTEIVEARDVIATIISLANTLKMEVIAEGVETEVQAQMIQHFGCSHTQGFLFGRPLPGEQVETRFDMLPDKS